GEARILVAAERRIHAMVGDDARIFTAVVEAAQRAFGQLARLSDAQTDTTRNHRHRLLGAGTNLQPSIWPPSTVKVWPVIQDAASLHRNTAALATSSGAPSRPQGIELRIA